jgi:quinoprotein glucose dehydrogenase
VPTTIESDVVVIGAGITSAMLVERLAETTTATITVIEAGNRIFNLDDRYAERERFLAYRENPWPGDHIEGQTADGIMSRSMSVGGQAMHWGGVTPRFTPEDFRVNSLYGIGYDWPLTYDELDPYYQEAEERMGVAGEQGPPEYDRRGSDYPLPPLPLSYNVGRLKEWAEKSDIPFWRTPVAKLSQPYRGRNVCMRCDTCNICPTGAKYSPDFSFIRLLDENRIELHSRRLVRKLALRPNSDRIEYAEVLDRDNPEEITHYRAKTFIVAAGYCWSPHLLLLSANDRYPTGIANSSGHVGKYMSGHRSISNIVEVPEKLYPGVYIEDSLISKRFQKKENDKYIRHDLRIWESDFERRARLKDAGGNLMLGDAILDEWRERSATGAAQLRAYYDVIPAKESSLTLSNTATNSWGDPLPVIRFADSDWTRDLLPDTEASIRNTFDRIIAAGGGKSLSLQPNPWHDHPCGGCRMGADPGSSVVDPFGRTHDHENLWVVGTPTLVSSGCNNGTLTFSALALRSAAALAEELPASTSA